jgi:micrococcal nuclease
MAHGFGIPYFFTVILILTLQSCHSPAKGVGEEYYAVTKVVDGDTFWIDDGTRKGKKIRLIGVDAPETRRTARKEIGYYGDESKKYLTGLLLHKAVRLEYDVDTTDRYGRTLAYVYLDDGTFVNAALVKQGYAMVLTVPPNVRYAERFVKYQAQARKKGRGLWAR